MAKLKLDLHPIYNNSNAIDKALQQIFEEAIDKKIREVEIITGKGSGQLKRKCSVFYNSRTLKHNFIVWKTIVRILVDYLFISNFSLLFNYAQFLPHFYKSFNGFIQMRLLMRCT